ncbi:MAG: family N-acetyltransferase [Sediminibacterium sp.]|nr:family N-acetyltransferase [Sediminibacterium sp.]
MEDILVRPIQPGDNAAMARIIRSSLEEFGSNRPGTVYYDETTDHLYELFAANPSSRYFVAEKNNTIIGGAGIYPTDALPEGTCELVKMYLLPQARGLGLGRSMIDRCLKEAAAVGFTEVYLETMPELKKAVRVYEKFGFGFLTGPMGNSGHNGCGIWMLKKL